MTEPTGAWSQIVHLSLLKDTLILIDTALSQIDERVSSSIDPDAMGLIDQAEFLCGIGFVSIQRYLSSMIGTLGIDKKQALSIGPTHQGGQTIANLCHAGANFWKHGDEWREDELDNRERNTRQVIESATSRDEYQCVKLAESISGMREVRFLHLLPLIEEWSDRISERTRRGAIH